RKRDSEPHFTAQGFHGSPAAERRVEGKLPLGPYLFRGGAHPARLTQCSRARVIATHYVGLRCEPACPHDRDIVVAHRSRLALSLRHARRDGHGQLPCLVLQRRISRKRHACSVRSRADARWCDADGYAADPLATSASTPPHAHRFFHLMLQPMLGRCSIVTGLSASTASQAARRSAPVTGMSLPGRLASN